MMKGFKKTFGSILGAFAGTVAGIVGLCTFVEWIQRSHPDWLNSKDADDDN